MAQDGKRWHHGAGEAGFQSEWDQLDGRTRNMGDYVSDPKVEAFLSEIAEVCRRHGFHLEHEDSQGAFIVEVLDDGAEPSLLRGTHIGASVPVEGAPPDRRPHERRGRTHRAVR